MFPDHDEKNEWPPRWTTLSVPRRQLSIYSLSLWHAMTLCSIADRVHSGGTIDCSVDNAADSCAKAGRMQFRRGDRGPLCLMSVPLLGRAGTGTGSGLALPLPHEIGDLGGIDTQCPRCHPEHVRVIVVHTNRVFRVELLIEEGVDPLPQGWG
jgi:hypothetical protein